MYINHHSEITEKQSRLESLRAQYGTKRPFCNDNEILWFDSLDELGVFLNERNVPLVGIEIMDGAKSVLEEQFSESIAIMPGHEGDGLSKTQKKLCQSFVYIPQYGNGTASLNVFIATTIILHKYSLWSSRL